MRDLTFYLLPQEVREELLRKAQAAERENKKARKVAVWLALVGVVLLVGAHVLIWFMEHRWGIKVQNTWREPAIGLPAVLPLTLAGLIAFGSRVNPVMELRPEEMPKD